MFSAIVYLNKIGWLSKNSNTGNFKARNKGRGFPMDRALSCARFFADFLWQGNVDMLAACEMQSLIIRS